MFIGINTWCQTTVFAEMPVGLPERALADLPPGTGGRVQSTSMRDPGLQSFK